MQLKNEFQPIRDWAKEKGILEKGKVLVQFGKTVEEVGELAKALIETKPDEVKDALGDVTVTLVILAELYGVSYEECVNNAYNVIAKRKGKMDNGTFIRDKE